MRSKLITAHDRYHLHKTLGAAALTSFAVHYCVHWPRTGALAASWPAIFLHLALSTSGIVFTVPVKRITKWPTMMWEEYRMHAIVFSYRALVVAALDGFPRLIGIGLVHGMADFVSAVFGQAGETTVRGVHAVEKSFRMRATAITYAGYQYLALASHLVGRNRMDLAYNAFIGVQSSAFCMTLHRKGLITWKTHAIVYSACIALSAAFIVQSIAWWQTLGALLAGWMRFNGANKYALWTAYWLICMQIQAAT